MALLTSDLWFLLCPLSSDPPPSCSMTCAVEQKVMAVEITLSPADTPSAASATGIASVADDTARAPLLSAHPEPVEGRPLASAPASQFLSFGLRTSAANRVAPSEVLAECERYGKALSEPTLYLFGRTLGRQRSDRLYGSRQVDAHFADRASLQRGDKSSHVERISKIIGS
jgi:hypothetical protein